MSRNSCGFTLIEVLVAIFLAANIMIAAGVALVWSMNYFTKIRDHQMGTAQAMMALRLIEMNLKQVGCISDAACGANPANFIGSPREGTSSNFLSGRIDRIGAASTFFGIEYNGAVPGILTYCTAASMPTSCAGNPTRMIVARNIMNGTNPVFRRNIAPTDRTIRAVVQVREGAEGRDSRIKTYQSTFVISLGD